MKIENWKPNVEVLKTSQSNLIKYAYHFAQWTRAPFGMWASEHWASACVSMYLNETAPLSSFSLSFFIDKISTATATHVLNRLSFSVKICSTVCIVYTTTSITEYCWFYLLLLLQMMICFAFHTHHIHTRTRTHTERKLISSKLTEMRLNIFTQRSEA